MSNFVPYLVILSSGCQLYSGTGTALFEWIRYTKHIFDYSICIDNQNQTNYRIAREFCIAEGLRFLPSGPLPTAGTPDAGVARATELVASGKWPIVEIISWANSSTNMDVVSAKSAGTRVVYTPHTQPAWTIPNAQRYWALEPSLKRVLAASDLVCCDSMAEVTTVQGMVPSARAAFIPIGVDTGRFLPSAGSREPQILIVADFGEHRKRPDLSLAAIRRLLDRRPEFRAALAGKRSSDVPIDPKLQKRVTKFGYISESDLVNLYQKSSVFLLLSDYEAFGIPIVEALCCGTPVVANATPETSSLFGELPGCFLVNNTNEAAVDAAIESALLLKGQDAEIARSAANLYSLEAAFQLKLTSVCALLKEEA